jgi:rSAM/selenodomain-associated transferase 1
VTGTAAAPAGPVRALVLAKAPVAGRVKTRLGADVGLERAAELAAAALLDTVEACTTAYGAEHCHLALAGDLADAVAGPELLAATRAWQLHPQRGGGFDERLAAAHADVATSGPGPVVQVGMDTPQLTPALLAVVVAGLDRHDAVLGPAEDGGWWVLALRDPTDAAVLAGVEMSTERTHDDTLAALRARGLDVGTAPVQRDVDTVADADLVAAACPTTRFSRAWLGVGA